MPPVTRISALSALSLALLATPTGAQDPENLRPVAGQSASEPLPVETLLSLSSAVGGETPRWAPEGDRILLGGSNLRLIRAEGGAISELPVSTGGSGHFLASAEPQWSPDGQWISYVSDRSGTPEIWLWSLAGGEAFRITGNGGRLIKGYSWSPDGRRIAFSGNRHGQYDVWTVEVPSGEARRLTDGPELEVYPAWSPDSGSLLFVRLDGEWMDHEVVEVPADGGEERVIVRDEDFFDYGEGGAFGYPLVSPDGSTVVFPSYRSGWINYWGVPRSGGEPRPLVAAEADQTEGAWSPGGGGFAYVENHGGTYELRIAPAGGGEPRVIAAPESGIIAAPQWSPDGTRLSYTLETPTRPGDLVVHALASGKSSRLTDSMPVEAIGKRLVMPGKLAFSSGDGLTIPSYLYRPRRRVGRRRSPLSGDRLDPRRTHVAMGGQLRARHPVLRSAGLRGAAAQRARKLRVWPRVRGGQRRLLGQVRLRGCGGGRGVPPNPPVRRPGAHRNHRNQLRRVHVVCGGELRRRDLPGRDRGVRLLRPGHLLRGRRIPPPAAVAQGDGAARGAPGPLPRELSLLPPRRCPGTCLRAPRRGTLSGLTADDRILPGAAAPLQARPLQGLRRRELLRQGLRETGWRCSPI